MMNYQPQHIQKREIVDIQQLNINTNLRNNPTAIQLNQYKLRYKNTCYSWTEWNIDNSKIGSWDRDFLGVHFKFLFSFFLGLSVTIPSFWLQPQNLTWMIGSWHIYKWAMSHIRMSHVSHTYESRHTYEWVMSRILRAPLWQSRYFYPKKERKKLSGTVASRGIETGK